MATMIGSLLVSLGLESGEFKSGLTSAEKELKRATLSFEKIGKSMTNMGKTLSIAVTAPIIAFAAASVKGAQEQAAVMAQVNAALASMGDVSGKTARELAKTADALEMNSLYDADVILKQVTANLLTFGNVAGEQFDRAQQAAIDMATRLGGEPQAAAIMLGKALNDPIKGISALTRVGVQFTDGQKAQIEAMQAAGNAAGAQGIILAEVEKQFRGAAAAAADVTPWRKAQVAMNQMMDVVGKAILPLIPIVTDAIVSLANAFQSLSPGMQKAIVIGGALAAALGPLLFAFGSAVTAMAPFLATISVIAEVGGPLIAAKAGIAGLTAAFGPFALAAAAIAAAGYLIYENWDIIGPALTEFWNAAKAALGPELQSLVTEVSALFSEFWNGPLGEGIRDAGASLIQFQVTYTKVMGPALIAGLKLTIQAFGELVRSISQGLGTITSLLNGDVNGAIINFSNLSNTVFLGIPGYLATMVKSIKKWLIVELGAIWDATIGKINVVKNAFYNLYDAVVGHSYVPDMVDGIAAQMARLDAVMVSPVLAATSAAQQAFAAMAGEVRGILDRLFPDVAAKMTYDSERSALQTVLGENSGAAIRALANERDMARINNRPSIDTGAGPLVTDFEKVNAAIVALTEKAKIGTVAIAKSFKDMATDTVSALQSLTNSIKGGGFFDIFSSLVSLGLNLGGSGLFGKSFAAKINSIPAFAGGTNFAPGGMALVGERGPELVNLPRGSQVIPNHELGGGGANVRIVPSPYFDVVVDGRIAEAAPSIAQAGGAIGVDRMARIQSRSLGR